MDKVAKAVVAAVTAGAGAYGVAVSDGHVSAAEWGGVVVTALVAGFGVWATRNAPSTPEPPSA